MKEKMVQQEEIQEMKEEEEENLEITIEIDMADAVDGSVKLKDKKKHNVIR